MNGTERIFFAVFTSPGTANLYFTRRAAEAVACGRPVERVRLVAAPEEATFDWLEADTAVESPVAKKASGEFEAVHSSSVHCGVCGLPCNQHVGSVCCDVCV